MVLDEFFVDLLILGFLRSNDLLDLIDVLLVVILLLDDQIFYFFFDF